MLYAFELSSAGENIGIGFELQVITIVLLGGVSIFGGRGTILGVRSPRPFTQACGVPCS